MAGKVKIPQSRIVAASAGQEGGQAAKAGGAGGREHS